MAKELTPIKKGAASFNLIGKAKIYDFTFKTDMESQRANSDWVYNQMNLGVDCGNYGMIYAGMMGGFGTERQNVVYVHGKTERDGRKVDDFGNRFTIDWDDRHDESLFENIGDMCFITVGIEKDEDDKTIYRKFLSPYDAILYIKENLKDDTVVNVRGNLKWQEYNGKITCQKEITSIALSRAESKDFKAVFTQTLLVDQMSIGKADKDTMTIPIDAYVVDHVQEYKGQKITRVVNGRTVKGTMLPLLRAFDVKVDADDKDRITKMLRLFRTRGKKVLQITVDGYFSKGELETVAVTEADIPDDIKELIELGYIDKKEILDKIAYANGGGNKPEQMFIKAPHIKVVNGLPVIDRMVDVYVEDDINIDFILENCQTELAITEDDKGNDDSVDIESAIDAALENDDLEEEDWLAGL